MWRPPSSLASAAGPTSGAVEGTRPTRGSASACRCPEVVPPADRGHPGRTRSIRRVIFDGALLLVKPPGPRRRPNRPSPLERVIDTALPGVTSGGSAGGQAGPPCTLRDRRTGLRSPLPGRAWRAGTVAGRPLLDQR